MVTTAFISYERSVPEALEKAGAELERDGQGRVIGANLTPAGADDAMLDLVEQTAEVCPSFFGRVDEMTAVQSRPAAPAADDARYGRETRTGGDEGSSVHGFRFPLSVWNGAIARACFIGI